MRAGGRFVLVVAIHAGGYFRTDRQARVCGNFSMSLSPSITNLFWTWGWPGHRGVFEYWGVFGMLSLFLYESKFSDDFQWGLVSCGDE